MVKQESYLLKVLRFEFSCCCYFFVKIQHKLFINIVQRNFYIFREANLAIAWYVMFTNIGIFKINSPQGQKYRKINYKTQEIES